MSVTVYGYSDDLIEIEGDISEEFTGEDENLLAFSDGTVLRVNYGPYVWRIDPVTRGTAELHIEKTSEDEDDSGYSDLATLTGDIRWVVRGNEMAKRT